MFTFLFGLFGFVAFIISLATVGFKSAFKRLLAFVTIGLVLDLITFLVIGTIVFTFH